MFLKELYLDHNTISDIKVFGKAKFENMEKLFLNFNNIYYIDILEKINWKELKELHLENNVITNINVFNKISFEKFKLTKLYLVNNKIDFNKYSKIMSLLKSKIKYLYY